MSRHSIGTEIDDDILAMVEEAYQSEPLGVLSDDDCNRVIASVREKLEEQSRQRSVLSFTSFSRPTRLLVACAATAAAAAVGGVVVAQSQHLGKLIGYPAKPAVVASVDPPPVTSVKGVVSTTTVSDRPIVSIQVQSPPYSGYLPYARGWSLQGDRLRRPVVEIGVSLPERSLLDEGRDLLADADIAEAELVLLPEDEAGMVAFSCVETNDEDAIAQADAIRTFDKASPSETMPVNTPSWFERASSTLVMVGIGDAAKATIPEPTSWVTVAIASAAIAGCRRLRRR
jgi:hypothetical protein